MNWAGTNRVAAGLVAALLVTSVFAGTVAFSGEAAAEPGDVLYRVNAGDETIAAVDGGPDWTAVTETPYVNGGTVYNRQMPVSTEQTPSVPKSVLQSEVYGNQTWTFTEGIENGTRYEVRLYFAEITDRTQGDRIFDVNVEGGPTELDDYDIYADVGGFNGTVHTYTVAPSDGEISIALSSEVNNAKISAIEIVDKGSVSGSLAAPSSSWFGGVVVGNEVTESVTVTNLGSAGDEPIDLSDVSLSGDEAFTLGSLSQTTLDPGESVEIPITFSPSTDSPAAATLSISHSGANSPQTVNLSGYGDTTVPVGFDKTALQGFDADSLTALEFGPDGRLYAAAQNGTVYALGIERTDEGAYSVTSSTVINAVRSIPNHDDTGARTPNATARQVTGLTVGGTADSPVVYVSSSDPRIDSGSGTAIDTNSGTISRLTLAWNADGTLSEVSHTVLVMGLPRSEDNHATNGLALSADGETLYVAQGGNTNNGGPSNGLDYSPEYALSAAVLSVDLAQIEANHDPKNLQNYDSNYPDLEFLYAIPTIQTDDATDGDDLPFGGQGGANQAKWVEGGPVQVFASGYRNPYDIVRTTDGDLYVPDNGPNGGWGGTPVGEGTASCTNEPSDGGTGSGDQLHLVTEGAYGGHPAPIRGNPTGADIYDGDGTLIFDVNESNSPVPASEVDAVECDYQSPSEDSSIGDPLGWTAGIAEYTASNFDGTMQGNLLVVVNANSVTRIRLDEDGDAVTDRQDNFFSGIYALGIATVGDDGPFPGTVWTARDGVTVFEPADYGGTDVTTCTGADDPSLDEDGDGYDNADELDAGTDPCSAASTPADFDGDGTSNLNDPDDDNDGTPDTSDPFAVDPDDGTTTTLPIEMDLTETALFGESGQGWTGLMTSGDTDYAARYDPESMTVGGAAGVLTVENVPEGDAVGESQQYAFQRGFVPPSEPFTIETTVNGLPADPEDFQSLGMYIGTGDQENYLKLVAGANGGNGGVQFAKETNGSFESVSYPFVPEVRGPSNDTTLSMTVYPSNDTVHAYYTTDGGERTFLASTTIPAEWLDTSDGSGLAVGVIATSNGANETFDATWTHLTVTPSGDGDSETGDSTPPATNVSLSPATAVTDENGTATLDVVVDDAAGGVGTYTLTVTVDDPSVARITGVDLAGSSDGGLTNVNVTENGSAATIEAVLTDTNDSGPVTLGTVSVELVDDDPATLSLDVAELGTESGTLYEVIGTNGATVESSGVYVGGSDSPAKDPDGDGAYEDVNGDGTVDLLDVQTLFAARNDESVQNAQQAFDFNGDETFSLIDIQVLFADETT